jgi:hypothetical protein
MHVEVVSSVEPDFAAATGWDGAFELLGAVDFALVALEAAFVAEGFTGAGFVGADVWVVMLV